MIKTVYLASTLLLCAANLAQASGTYIPSSGRVPSKKSGMDSAKYSLGQKTFEGKMMADGAGSAKAQKSALMAIQAKVPEGKGNVTALAGKITDEQVSALDYYVSKRFGM